MTVRVLLPAALPAAMQQELAARHPDVEFVPLTPDGAVPARGVGAEALLRVALSKPQLSAALNAALGVKWVHTSTAGFDWALVPEITERNIILTRSAAAYAVPIGEFAITLISGLVKRLPAFATAQRERAWADLEPYDLDGLQVGVVGAGAIGAETAWRGAALGMRFRATKRTQAPLPNFEHVYSPADLHELGAGSRVVVIACPLTPETRGLIGAAELAAMPPGSYLVNVARGAIVDSAALVAALDSGHLAGAALDAFETEPLPTSDPFWSAPNLLLTPHTSFKSARNLTRVVDEFEVNLKRFMAGEELLNGMRHPELGY